MTDYNVTLGYRPTLGVTQQAAGLVGPAGPAGVGIGTTFSVNTSGIITASYFVGNGSLLTNIGYANTAGIATYATNAGVSTYSTSSGIATYATYATNAGISTYATSAGIATYATKAGVSTNVIGGIASITSLSVSGITTLGVVTAVTSINFAGGAFNISGNKIRNVSDNGLGLVAGSEIDVTVAKTVISNEVINNLGGGSSLTSGSRIELSNANTSITNGVTNDLDGSILAAGGLVQVGGTSVSIAVQTLNSLGSPGPTLTSQRLVEARSSDVRIGLKVINDDGGGGIITGFDGWTFGTVGVDQALTFPDNTIQSTAFTGYASTAGIATYATSAGIATNATYATNAGIATYATNAGIATYATNAGVSTYATSAGIATYATSSGIATYATNAGVSTYATSAGIATYATSSGIATVAQGLTGTPNISVGIITATDYRIQSVAEKTTLVDGNTVSLVYNTGGGNVAICTNPSGNITLNVTGIPTDSTFDNYSLAFSVIVTNTGTARSCTAINLNGVSETILWFGGSLAAAISGVTTSNGYDVYSFTGINTVGSASTTSNYIVLGSVNGSYR
jgi:hypothetical protein